MSTSSDPLRERYDETPYRDQAFSDFDTARLLGMAQLFGSRPEASSAADVSVLDLACASGVHLREQAARYPAVRFTGIDFSLQEIEIGRKAIREAGLTNVELIHADLRSVEIEQGAHDVVLCHGTFSWVEDEVKERILQLIRLALQPSGIAAIAYLTYPGWKQREAMRELLSMRVRNLTAPEDRLRESALVLRFLRAGYKAHDDNPHAAGLLAVVESMQKSATNVFLHDELGAIHDPCYFMQFAEWARECGLEYLAEVDLGMMSIGGMDSDAVGLLREMSPDFLETQQMIDFVVNRSSRTSMLVRNDAEIRREIVTETLESLSFTTRCCDVTPLNARTEAARRFENDRGQRVELGGAEQEALLTAVIASAPDAIAHSSLVGGKSRSSEEYTRLREALLALVAQGLLDPMAELEGSREEGQ